MAAVAIGARSQALWLVAPMLTLALIARRGAGATRARFTALAIFGATCLAWLVPLLTAAGGIDGYLATLADQAGEDFAGVEMVWTTPSARVIALALRYVLLDVWGPLPVGILMVVASATGLAALLMRNTTALLVAGVLWLPYFVFHLLFQETATSRYDLPLVPPMAWLATQGLLWLPRQALPLIVAGRHRDQPVGDDAGAAALRRRRQSDRPRDGRPGVRGARAAHRRASRLRARLRGGRPPGRAVVLAPRARMARGHPALARATASGRPAVVPRGAAAYRRRAG